MEDDFLKTLKQNPPKHRATESLQILDRLCSSIEDYTYNKVQCRREAGFATNYGQEWRVIIKPAAQSFNQILFRAYVPLDGYPVQIDLYGGEMKVCPNEAALRKALTGFLKQQTVQDTISYFSDSGSG